MSDDFSDATKRVLASRVGNLCSNPLCRALTSGPQEDPQKALNIGVAAHITAASAGGPRYDPDLLPEERSSPSNGIWLCQNCAKLIDNDIVRFSVEMLKGWKTTAEADAKARIGKTSQSTSKLIFPLAKYSKVRITPVVPREHEQSQFMLMEEHDEYLELQKLDSQRYVTIPKSFIETVHLFGNSAPALLRLSGRLQWVSTKRNFELFPDRPPSGPAGTYGIPKDVDSRYAARLGIACKYARWDRLPEVLSQGWLVFYDLDGTYLRWGGQVLIVDWV